MPTTAKLIAALWFAALAWAAANGYYASIGQAQAGGYGREIAALIGALCGWRHLGAGVGQGYMAAIGLGLKTAVIVLFWALVGLACVEMMDGAVKIRFDGPMAALLGFVDALIKNAGKMLTLGVLSCAVFAGVGGGSLAEFTGRRWR